MSLKICLCTIAALHLTALRDEITLNSPQKAASSEIGRKLSSLCGCAGGTIGSVCKPGLPATCSVMIDTGNPGVSLPQDVYANLVTLLGGTDAGGGAACFSLRATLGLLQRISSLASMQAP